MKILATRPCGGSTMVDVEIAAGVRLYNLRLSTGGDGHPRLHAPNAYGTKTAGFDTPVIRAVAAAVKQEQLPHDRRS